jgi:hypothetical protein
LSQFFIDWRNPNASTYFINAIVKATQADGVDATFTDDREGVPNEHPELGPTLNMTSAEMQAMQTATQVAGQRLATALAAAGKTCWDCIGGTQGERNQLPPTRNNCIAQMRRYCAPDMQRRGMFMEFGGDANHTVAAFLVSSSKQVSKLRAHSRASLIFATPSCTHPPLHSRGRPFVYPAACQ